MRLLIVAATPFEIAPLTTFLKDHYTCTAPNVYQHQKASLEIRLLVTGIGQMLTAYAMGYVLANEQVDFAINAGIAGAYNRSFPLGNVYNVVQEQLGDLGAEDADGRFLSIHELGLLPANEAPFLDGCLKNTSAMRFDFLPKATGVTVNLVNGYTPNIIKAHERHRADLESMEGAAFAYVCGVQNINYLQLRAISNYVESRQREAWNLPLSIGNLNKVLLDILNTLVA
ncbi:MAG: futalosine hydrolase [Bacteroidota bacterium]